MVLCVFPRPLLCRHWEEIFFAANTEAEGTSAKPGLPIFGLHFPNYDSQYLSQMSRVYIIYLRIAQASRKHLDLAHHSITLKSLISENSLQLRIPLRPWAANAEGRSRNISGQCLAKSTTSAPESCEKRVAQDCSNMSNLKRHPANLKWQNEWACCTSLHEELYTLYYALTEFHLMSFHMLFIEHGWKLGHMPGRYPIKTCLATSAVSASGEAKKKTNLLGDTATVEVQFQLYLVIVATCRIQHHMFLQ